MCNLSFNKKKLNHFNCMYQSFMSMSKIFIVCICLCVMTSSMQAQMSTQVGIGALYINGDVDHVFDPLNSFHLGVSKTFRKNFNAELKVGFGKTVGLSGTYMETFQNGGGLVEDVYADIGNEVWYPNYLSTYAYADLGVNYILNTGIERLRFIGGLGLGASISNTSINLYRTLDNVDFPYTLKLPVSTSLEEAKNEVNRDYDSTYETKFDEGGLTPHLSLQIGIQFKLQRGIYFSADARYHLSTSDYLDPIKNISATEESGNNDSVSIITFGFIGYLLQDEKEEVPAK